MKTERIITTTTDDGYTKARITGITISRQGLENIERLCADCGSHSTSTAQFSVSPWTCTDDLPENWHIFDLETHKEWVGLYESEIMRNVIVACEPSLAEVDFDEWLCDMGDCLTSTYLIVDDTLENAPALEGVMTACKRINELVASTKNFAEYAELVAAEFRKTSLARGLGLHIEHDDETMQVAGRPHLAVRNIPDAYFGTCNLLDQLGVLETEKYDISLRDLDDYCYLNDEEE